jgi:hypothetical protein
MTTFASLKLIEDVYLCGARTYVAQAKSSSRGPATTANMPSMHSR